MPKPVRECWLSSSRARPVVPSVTWFNCPVFPIPAKPRANCATLTGWCSSSASPEEIEVAYRNWMTQSCVRQAAELENAARKQQLDERVKAINAARSEERRVGKECR